MRACRMAVVVVLLASPVWGAGGEYVWWEGEAASEATRTRSPLSRPAEQPYVIGHFQIDPDGRFTTPLQPADEALAGRAGDWPAPASLRAKTRATVSPVWALIACQVRPAS